MRGEYHLIPLIVLVVALGCGGSGADPAAGRSVLDSSTVDTGAARVVPPGMLAVDTTTFSGSGPIALVPVHVRLAKGLEFDLRIPEGYELKVAAEGMERPRFITPSPDGRLFLTDMHDLTDNKKGRVYILSGWNEDSARFEERQVFLDKLRNPNQVTFLTTSRDSFLYVATTDNLLRFDYHKGDTLPVGAPMTIDTFPNYGLSYKYGGWHLTRSLSFNAGKLYVSVGSSCNACIEKEQVRATILQMDPDGRNQRIYASGLRNAVGMQWVMGDLFATDMGSDQFGTEAPEDKLQHVTDGGFYGWPYFYQRGEEVVLDTTFAKPNMRLQQPLPAYAALGAHSATLGFDFFHDFADTRLRNSFVVALHGSSIVKMGKGYKVVRVRRGYPTETVIDGFLQDGERYGRPCDVMVRDADSFWLTDDMNGVLYLVRRKR